MSDMESLLQDLRSEGMQLNRQGKTGLGSLLFLAYNTLIELSKSPVSGINHEGSYYEPVDTDEGGGA